MALRALGSGAADLAALPEDSLWLRWLGKSRRTEKPHAGKLGFFCAAYGLLSLPDVHAALAAQAADRLPSGYGHWMAVQPVHLIPDRDTLVLAPEAAMVLTMAEAQSLAVRFNEHFAEQEGYWLQPLTPTLWLLGTRHHDWQLSLPVCEDAQGMNLRDAWQAGADAGRWRRLLNETQMLFFDSQVNAQRETEGALAVNGLWPLPSGQTPDDWQGHKQPCLMSDDDALLQLAQSLGIRTHKLMNEQTLVLPQSDVVLWLSEIRVNRLQAVSGQVSLGWSDDCLLDFPPYGCWRWDWLSALNVWSSPLVLSDDR